MPILMVDFNAYFASVEQQMQPRLRGKPVVVVPVDADSTCCIAVSYEARAWGIKTGTLVADAKRVCPKLNIVVARPELYVRVHERIIDAVEKCIHIEEVASIDEMWGEVYVKSEGEGQDLAEKIKKRVREDVGEYLRCSIGIGPNVFLAKVATDLEKPDGFAYLTREDVPKRLLHLELRDLCGIGKRMEERLRRSGIQRIAELYASSREFLRAVWGGVEGERFYEMLRGGQLDRKQVFTRSLGHSHVLPPEARNLNGAYAVGHRLLQKAAMRLRHKKLVCGKLGIEVRLSNRKKWVEEVEVSYTCDTKRLLEAYEKAWGSLQFCVYSLGALDNKICSSFLAVGVYFSDLRKVEEMPYDLFESDQRRERLCMILDSINQRYGRGKILWGGAILSRDAAPMRIAFSRVPNMDLEGDWVVEDQDDD
jgi:DNA polymerase-4